MTLKKTLACLLFLNLAALSFFAQTPGCICPSVKIKEPEFVARAGEAIEFSAEITGWKDPIEYNWTVSAGVISEGQGTPAIKVDTRGVPGGTTIAATLRVVGNWCPACDNTTVTATAAIAEEPKPVLSDKFVRGNCEELLARMDAYFIELQNNPSATGYVIIYGKPRAAGGAEQEARRWIKFRRFDPARLTFVRGGGSDERTRIEQWLVPPGADPPESSEAPETVEPDAAETANVEFTKPYIFTERYADGVDGCKPEFDVEGFAKALAANPKGRANVVIRESSQAAFRLEEKEILDALTQMGVSKKRIKTFFVKIPRNQAREAVELWLLP